MQKRTVWGLALCLAILCCAGAAGAETPSLMKMEPEIVFDGTILDMSVKFSPTGEGYALVDAYQLEPDTPEKQDLEAVLAKGLEAKGVYCVAELLLDGAAVETRVFYDKQEDSAVRKGTIYLLLPGTAIEGLTGRLDGKLVGDDGAELETFEHVADLSTPIDAKTCAIPADVKLGDATLEEVFVSSSSQGLCVSLRYGGEMLTGVTYHDPEAKEEVIASFALNEDYESSAVRWSMYAFMDVTEIPDEIALSISNEMTGEDVGTLVINLAEKTVVMQ